MPIDRHDDSLWAAYNPLLWLTELAAYLRVVVADASFVMGERALERNPVPSEWC